MVAQIMLHTVRCPVCGSNVSVNNKKQLAEHKRNGSLCYGSFMPESEPKFLEPPKSQFAVVGGNRYIGWNQEGNYGSSSMAGNIIDHGYVAVGNGTWH